MSRAAQRRPDRTTRAGPERKPASMSWTLVQGPWRSLFGRKVLAQVVAVLHSASMAPSRFHRWLTVCRPGLVAVLMLAVFIRALVPAGYMLSADQTVAGLPGLVICSAVESHKTVPPGSQTGGEQQAPAGTHDQPCGFAQAVANSVPPPTDLVIAYVALFRVAPPLEPDTRVRTPDVAGTQLGARAPPLAA